MSESEACYVGVKACGCVVAMCVDNYKYRKDVADTVAQFIAEGLTVERLSLEDGVRRIAGNCEHGVAIGMSRTR